MIRIASEIDECRALWERFSTHERIWDEWELMWAYHDPEQYDLRFQVLERDGEPQGMIPLVHDRKDGSHELFGGCYPDNRPLWLQPGDFPEFFDALPEQTVLFDLEDEGVQAILREHPGYAPNFADVDQRYFLVPAAFGFDFNNHIATFSSEKRKGFLYDLRKIREKQPELVWSEDDESELFIDLVNRNFGAESDYVSEPGKNEVRRAVATLKRHGWLRTLTIAIDGVRQAVSLSLLYKGVLIAAYSASNNEIKNLGKLLNVETIQEACRLRLDEVNYMTGMAWKAAWKMNSEPCRTMRKPAKVEAPVEEAPTSPSG